MRRAALILLAWFAASGAAHAELSSCPLRSERAMIETQLFFGQDVDGRGPVTKDEWSSFVAHVIAEGFPEGFTVTDGDGSWFDPKTKSMIHEESKIVLIVTKQSPGLSAKLTHVMETYKTQFHQHSVGLVTRQVCAAF
jgi:hypothetical protein